MKTNNNTPILNAILAAVLGLTILLSSSFTASAQRTGKGQFLFTADATTNMFNSIGWDLSVGQYLKYSYWNAGIMSENPRVPVNGAGENVTFARFTPFGSFMYRLIGTSNRVFNVYGGADIFFGLEFIDLYAQLTNETYRALLNAGYPQTKFIYGGGLKIELEVFPFRSWAIVLPVRAHLTGNTSTDQMFAVSAGLGVRFNY